MSSLRSSGGFSLIELVVVVVVLGAVFAVAAPRYSRGDVARRADLAADRISRDIRLAERDAWHRGVVRELVFDVASDTYRIVGMVDGTGKPYVVDLSAAPYRLSVESADFGGEARIVLDGRGTAPAVGRVELSAGGVRVEAEVETRESGLLSMTVSTTDSLTGTVEGTLDATANLLSGS